MKQTTVEVCPGCGSLEVRAAEPSWFLVEIARREEIGGHQWVERLELSCRECGTTWE